MGEPSWETHPSTYDGLTISTTARAYGWQKTKVTIDGTAGLYKWDVKEVPSSDGARISPKGITPARPSVTWQLWTREHEVELSDFIGGVLAKPGKTGPARILVVHPDLQRFALGLFVVEGMTLPKRVEPGIYEVTLKLIQWFDQPKESKQPATAGGKTLAQYASNGLPVTGTGMLPPILDAPSIKQLEEERRKPPSATKPAP